MLDLMPFCRENMEYIMNDETYEKRMLEIVRSGSVKALLKFVEWKHFDKQHPENYNIKFKKNDTNTLEIYNGRKWVSNQEEEVLKMMFERLCDDIDTFIKIVQSNGSKVSFKKFIENIGKPLGFDMLYLDLDVNVDDEKYIDAKIKIYHDTLELIKKKTS